MDQGNTLLDKNNSAMEVSRDFLRNIWHTTNLCGNNIKVYNIHFNVISTRVKRVKWQKGWRG